MILRRLTKHVKDQNWFAVGLDFVIVVAGVFLGIQIGNWNTDLALHHRAGKLEQQLKAEMAAEALNYRFARRYYEDAQANGEAVLGNAEGVRTLSVPADRIAFAVQVLREAHGLAPALRFRIAEMDNTNALMVGADEVIQRWRMMPEAYDMATKPETSK